MYRAAAVLVLLLAAVAVRGDYGVPSTDLNLRTGPTTRTRNVITVLGTADHFEILETKRAWYRVRVVATGAEGWVAKRYVRLTPKPAPPPAQSVDPGSAQRIRLVVMVAIIALLVLLMGYVASSQEPSATSPQNHPLVLLASLVVGTTYVAFTLPRAMISIGTDREWSALANFGHGVLDFNQHLSELAPLPALMQGLFWAILLYVASLFVLAIRHGRMELFTWGAVTLVLSTAVFHVVAWAAYIALRIALYVFAILAFIGRFLGMIFGAVLDFIRWIGVALYELLYLLLGSLWWLVPLAAALLILGLVLRNSRNWIDALKIAGAVLVTVSGLFVVLYVLRWLWRLVGPWITAVLLFLGKIVVFIGAWALRLVAGLFLLVVLAAIGQLLVDQIRSALSAGRGRRGITLGAISIGSSIAILMFVSNFYGVTEWAPAWVAAFAVKYLHQPAPLLDALIALGIVAASIVGVWRRIRVLGTEPTKGEYRQAIVYSVVGILANIGLGAIGTQTEE